MADEKKLAQARSVFETLCRTLDKHEWKYSKDEEKLMIECGAQGDDLPMKITVMVDASRSLIMLLSHIPFVIQEDKRLDLAVAVSAVNNRLVDGSFDYDVIKGNMCFRMTNSYIESVIGEEVISYMLFCSCQTIDEYNDKFLMLAKGIVSIEQFIGTVLG